MSNLGNFGAGRLQLQLLKSIVLTLPNLDSLVIEANFEMIHIYNHVLPHSKCFLWFYYKSILKSSRSDFKVRHI